MNIILKKQLLGIPLAGAPLSINGIIIAGAPFKRKNAPRINWLIHILWRW